jgi:hypothetical protein
VGLCVLGRGCDRLTDEIIYILFSFFPDMSSVRVGGNGITGLHMQLFGGGKTLPKNIKDSVNQLRGAIQVRAFLALGGRTHTHTQKCGTGKKLMPPKPCGESPPRRRMPSRTQCWRALFAPSHYILRACTTPRGHRRRCRTGAAAWTWRCRTLQTLASSSVRPQKW